MGLATYQGETVSSSSEEQEMESTISETHGERESSEQTEQPQTSRKRKRGDRTASYSLSSVDHTRKSRKVAVEYSTDETDEEKIPEMGEGMALPQKMKMVKLTLLATPSQVHLVRSFVEWFTYNGMRPGMRAALVSRKWTDRMIDEFIENFRQKHGFNCHTAMLPYVDEEDSDGEPIELEGGQKMVIQRCIISPDEPTMPKEDPDKLEDLGAQPKKCPAPEPGEGEGGSIGPPPGKKPKKPKQVKTLKPKKDPKPKKPKKGKKSKKAAESGEPCKTPQMGDLGQMPQMGEQDPTPGSAPGPAPAPRPGDPDPLEGKTPPLRPEGEPMPLETDPSQADVRAIPLPPGPPLPPPPHQPPPPPDPQPQPKLPMPSGRATPLSTPGHRTPPEGETDPLPQQEPEELGPPPPGRQGGWCFSPTPLFVGQGTFSLCYFFYQSEWSPMGLRALAQRSSLDRRD